MIQINFTTLKEGCMETLRKSVTLLLMLALIAVYSPKLEAVTYVTDTGGYAYDESRAATNLAPAIALATVVIVAIIAVAVQNSHLKHSHSHSSGSDDSSSYFNFSSSSSGGVAH